MRIRRMASSASTPITESCGPVMPASVMKAVPFGRTVASEVWTCVCVPTTAVTRPSSQRASAAFSLVASAWTSTSTTRRLAPRLLHELVDHLEHRGRRVEEEGAEHVDHAEPTAVRRRHHGDSAARSRTGRVRRAHDPIRRVEVGADLGSPERVVPERDRIDAHPEELVGEARRDADAVRGVLSVHDAGVDLELRPHRLQALFERSPSGRPHDVGDEEDAQGRDSRG